MDSVDVTRVLLVRSSFTCMEENMKANVTKGGCEASGHYGIQPDGKVQPGSPLPHFGYSSPPPPTGTLKVLLLGGEGENTWTSLDHLITILCLMYPTLKDVVAKDEELKEFVEERYGA